MNWILLISAGILEVCWSVGMKYSHGFTRIVPSVFTILTMICSFILLSFTLRSFPLGTAYAVWTGIGAIGAALAGIVLFHEPFTLARMIFLLLIASGIAGLKFISPE